MLFWSRHTILVAPNVFKKLFLISNTILFLKMESKFVLYLLFVLWPNKKTKLEKLIVVPQIRKSTIQISEK